MSYYKIIFESDTIDGLKAIQGVFAGGAASANSSTALENPAPPPQQGFENANELSGVAQAPPPAANETGADSSLSTNSAVADPPPFSRADSAATDVRSEEENPPPPPQD